VRSQKHQVWRIIEENKCSFLWHFYTSNVLRL